MNKNIILTVTTGRSGTGTLHKIFDKIGQCHSKHEPIPHPFDFKNPKTFWIKRLTYIRQIREQFYTESSHLIAKGGFLEHLVEAGHIPGIIILKRNHRDVALSLLRLNAVPGLGNYAKHFVEVKGVDFESRKLNNYQKCFWYCLEVEKLQKKYSEMFEELGGKVFETSIDRMKDKGHLSEMFQYFGIPFSPQELENAVRVTDVPFNAKLDKKRDIEFTDEELDQFEEEVRRD